MAHKKNIPSAAFIQERRQLKAQKQEIQQAIEAGESLQLNSEQSLSLLKGLSASIDRLSQLEHMMLEVFHSVSSGMPGLQNASHDIEKTVFDNTSIEGPAKIKIKAKSSAPGSSSFSTGTSILNLSSNPSKHLPFSGPGSNSLIKIVRKVRFT